MYDMQPKPLFQNRSEMLEGIGFQVGVDMLFDAYKAGMAQLHHHSLFGELTETKITESYSNFTARKNAYFTFAENSDERLVIWGTSFGWRYLNDIMNVFFKESWDQVEQRLITLCVAHFGGTRESVQRKHAAFLGDFKKLHTLKYLPLEVRAIEEGTRYPIGLPIFTSKNTHPDMSSIVNLLETAASNTIYPMINCATGIDQFYLQARKYGEMSAPQEVVDQWLPICVHNFELRGMFGMEHGLRVGSASLLPFIGSDTTGAIHFMNYYYKYDPIKDTRPMCVSVRASEHADITRLIEEAIARGFTEDPEKEVLRLLALKTMGIFSYVADSKHYFRTIDVYARELKDVILAREPDEDGQPAIFVFRPDSAKKRPLEVIVGDKYICNKDEDLPANVVADALEAGYEWVFHKGVHYKIATNESAEGFARLQKVADDKVPAEVRGSLHILDDIFGSTEHDTQVGVMKLLNPKVGLIYGEAISQQHQVEIYKAMINTGFSACNLLMGKGSYGNLEGNTRDRFSMSYKQTFSKALIDGVEYRLEQEKSPMGDASKKSAKGLLMVEELVRKGRPTEYVLHQEVSQAESETGALKLLFRDSKFFQDNDFMEVIRPRYFAQTDLLFKDSNKV